MRAVSDDDAALFVKISCQDAIYVDATGYCINEKRAAQKGNFRVTLDSKILMYISTLRFSYLRKP